MPKVPRPIVVIGSGGIVRSAHLPAYEKADFPVIALADPSPGVAEALATERKIARHFTSVSEAIAFSPSDAVFDVAVPAASILPLLALLPDGATVLIQKPMGNTLDEARAIREACRRKSLTAAVNFQLRFAPNHLGARSLVEAGLLGEVHDIEIQVRTYTPWHLWSFLATAPRLEILYHSIHYIDLIRAWFGTPQSVYARTTRHPMYPALSATRSTIILDYGDTKRAVIHTNHGHEFPAESQHSFAMFEGDRGAARITMGVNLDYPVGVPDTLSFALRERQGVWEDLPITGNWFPDGFIGTMGSLQAFAEGSIAELPTSIESSFETMAVVEAAYLSSEGGGTPIPH